MKQNADFQEGIPQLYSTATPLPTPNFLTTEKSFQMMYSKEQMKVIRSHIMKQNGDFQEGISHA